MTRRHSDIGGNSDAIPVACSLTIPDLAAQSMRWTQLVASALLERAQTSDGLRISFRSEPGVEDELRALVAIENQCCGWADWTVESSASQVTVDVRATEEGIPALHAMFTQ